MNYIRHLTGFFDKVAKDKLLNPTHISLYIALFQFWNCNRFKNPISISRDEVMRISKISSKATYHKCLKALHSSGYIKYEPSYNPFKGSHVFLFNFSDDLKPLSKSERNSSNFEPVTKQVADKSRTATETSPELVCEQAVVPSINNTNISNDQNNSKGLNGNEPTKKEDVQISNLEEGIDIRKEKKLREKKKDDEPLLTAQNKPKTFKDGGSDLIPQLEDVVNYFTQENIPESEATKFYNYNNSIGWIIGGKSPITDWRSAANNWILKIPNFLHHEPTTRTKHLDTSAEKDYSEPL